MIYYFYRGKELREAKTTKPLSNTFTEKVFPTFKKNHVKIKQTCRINKNNLLCKLYIFRFFTCFKPHHENIILETTFRSKDIEATPKLLLFLLIDHNDFHQNLFHCGRKLQDLHPFSNISYKTVLHL